MDTMTTVSEVITNVSNNCLKCQGNALQIHPEEFVVDKHYRLERQRQLYMAYHLPNMTANMTCIYSVISSTCIRG